VKKLKVESYKVEREEIISPEGLKSGSPGYVRGSYAIQKNTTPDRVEVCLIF